MKKVLLILVLMFPIVVFAGSATVSKSSINVEVYENETFNIVVTNATGRFDVTSTDTSIVTVTANGVTDEDKITGGIKLWLDSAADENETTVTTVITVSALKVGSTTIKVKPIDAATYDTEEVITQTRTINVHVNAIPQPTFNLSNMEVNTNKHIMKNIKAATKISDFFNATTNNKYVQVFSASNALLYSNDNTSSTALLATGQYVTYYNESKQVVTYKISVKGDTNGDSNVSALDYVIVRKHIMETKPIVGDEFLDAADYDNNGEIKALDYVKIKNYIMSKN